MTNEANDRFSFSISRKTPEPVAEFLRNERAEGKTVADIIVALVEAQLASQLEGAPNATSPQPVTSPSPQPSPQSVTQGALAFPDALRIAPIKVELDLSVSVEGLVPLADAINQLAITGGGIVAKGISPVQTHVFDLQDKDGALEPKGRATLAEMPEGSIDVAELLNEDDEDGLLDEKPPIVLRREPRGVDGEQALKPRTFKEVEDEERIVAVKKSDAESGAGEACGGKANELLGSAGGEGENDDLLVGLADILGDGWDD